MRLPYKNKFGIIAREEDMIGFTTFQDYDDMKFLGPSGPSLYNQYKWVEGNGYMEEKKERKRRDDNENTN